MDRLSVQGRTTPVMIEKRKARLDLLLVERGLATSRQQAQRLVLAGQVTVDGQPADKPGSLVPLTAQVTIKERLPYVSRGGLKLAAALDAFCLDVAGWVVADVGASTGGFTDCLLQRGAARVYAIDVGHGQLAWKLQRDQRVVIMDRTNARYLKSLPEPVDLVTIDVSFISLKLIVPPAIGWLRPGGSIVALIKPQFEVGRDGVGRGGVVRDPSLHRAVLHDLIDWATAQGIALQGLIRSPVIGPAGNVEFLVHWVPGQATTVDLAPLLESCLKPEESET